MPIKKINHKIRAYEMAKVQKYMPITKNTDRMKLKTAERKTKCQLQNYLREIIKRRETRLL